MLFNMNLLLRYSFVSICILLVSTILLTTGCTKAKWEEIKPKSGVNTCDTTVTISYSVTIAPLMITSCGSDKTSCHNAKGANGNIVLETYTDVQQAALGGRMAIAITGGPKPMPMPPYTIATCDRDKILAWIHQGAKDN
jgi:hypothetical protein